MTQVNVGFPRFALLSDDTDKVFRAALTSSGAGEADGLGGGTLLGSGQLFSADGMDPNGGGAVRFDVSAGNAVTMRDTFAVYLEVTKDALDSTILPVAHSYIFSNGNGWFQKRTNGEFRLPFDSATLDLMNVLLRADDKPDNVPLLIMGDATDVYLYVDGLLCMKVARVRDAGSTIYEDWYFGALTTGTDGIAGESIRNVIGLKRLQTFPPSHIRSVVFIGTSFYANNGLDGFFSDADNDIFWYPGNGYDSGGVAIVPSTGTADPDSNGRCDTGVICQIIRKLSKAGHWPNNNVNRAQAGSLASGLTTQFAAALSDGAVPDMLFINSGTNDVAQVTPTATATVESNYQAVIEDAEQAGVSYCVIQQVLSTNNDTSYDDTVHETAVNDYNAMIETLPGWAKSRGMKIQIAIDRIFAKFGGHNVNTSLFITAPNVHPNAVGSSRMGVSAGDTAVRLVASSSTSIGIIGSSTTNDGAVTLQEGLYA